MDFSSQTGNMGFLSERERNLGFLPLGTWKHANRFDYDGMCSMHLPNFPVEMQTWNDVQAFVGSYLHDLWFDLNIKGHGQCRIPFQPGDTLQLAIYKALGVDSKRWTLASGRTNIPVGSDALFYHGSLFRMKSFQMELAEIADEFERHPGRADFGGRFRRSSEPQGLDQRCCHDIKIWIAKPSMNSAMPEYVRPREVGSLLQDMGFKLHQVRALRNGKSVLMTDMLKQDDVLRVRWKGLPGGSSEGENALSDQWQVFFPTGTDRIRLTRHHRIPRTALYIPDNLPAGITADMLRPERTTHVAPIQLNRPPFQRTDDWRADGSDQHLPYLWTGMSRFVVGPPVWNPLRASSSTVVMEPGAAPPSDAPRSNRPARSRSPPRRGEGETDPQSRGRSTSNRGGQPQAEHNGEPLHQEEAWRTTDGRSTNCLPNIDQVSRAAFKSTVTEYLPVDKICMCLNRSFTALLMHDEPIKEEDNRILVQAHINTIRPSRHQLNEILMSRCQCKVSQRTIIVEYTTKQWDYLLKHPGPVFAVGLQQWEGHITAQKAFLVPLTQPRQPGGTDIKCCDVFCGGFGGWHRATKALESVLKNHPSFQMVWALDRDQQAAQCYAENAKQWGTSHQTDVIQADVADHTWLGEEQLQAFDIAMMSSPCQPWSTAGWETGFSHESGTAVLHAIMKLAFARPSIILIENVAGFRTHEQWAWVHALLDFAHYQQVWETTSDLSEVLPQHRKRYLAVYRNTLDQQHPTAACCGWIPQFAVSLTKCDVILSPDQARSCQCELAPEVLQKYQDKNLAPSQRPEKRYKHGGSIFACVMGSYRHAHNLPHNLLQAKGLFGDLLRQDGGLRFLSHAEIAMLQGCVGHLTLRGTDKSMSLILGNAISVPHAALTIANGLTAFHRGRKFAIDPGVAVQGVLAKRLKACHVHIRMEDQAVFIIDAKETTEQVGSDGISPTLISDDFLTTHFDCDEDRVFVHAQDTECMHWFQTHLQVSRIRERPSVAILEVPHQQVHLNASFECIIADRCIIIARHECKLTEDRLRMYLPEAPSLSQCIVCENARGAQIATVGEQPDKACRPVKCLTGIARSHDSFRARGTLAIVNEDFRSLIQAEVPRQLQQLGWEVAIRCLGESNEPQMCVQPLLSGFRVGMDMMQDVLLHVASFGGAKSDIGYHARRGLEVLPPRHMECAIAWAGGATTYLQMPCTSTVGQVVRAFVGDHQQEVREVRHDGKWVSLYEPAEPFTRGVLRCHAPGLAGGAQKKQVAGPVRAQIAQVLLDGGCQIKRISDIVEQLSKKADPLEIDRILQTTDQQDKASALYGLAERLNIATPKKMDAKPATSARRPEQNLQCNPKLYALDPGFFANQDGTQPSILQEISHKATGVVLASHQEALPWLQAGHHPKDELAVLLLQHVNSDDFPDYHMQVLTCPATDAQGNRVVLRAQMIQMGQVDIKLALENHKPAAGATAPCHFTADAEDFEPQTWSVLISSPVKHILARLEETSRKAIVHIWGRSYQRNGKPSNPAQATSVRFYAQVDQAEIPKLTQQSGAASVSITAIGADGRPLQDNALIWVKDKTPADLSILLQKLSAHAGSEDAKGWRSGFRSRSIRRPGKSFDLERRCSKQFHRTSNTLFFRCRKG